MPAQREHRQGGRPEPPPVADLHQRRGERRHADHPGAQHQRATGRRAEPRVGEQLRVEQRRGHPALDEDERRERDDREPGQHDGGQVDPVAPLRERGDGQRHRRHQQRQPGDVHPVADRRRGLGHPPQARRDQSEREGGGDPEARPPAGTEVEESGQHPAGHDSEPDGGTPDRRRPEPVRAQRVTMRQHGQPARQHGGATAALDDPADHEHQRFDRDRAEHGSDAGGDQPGDVHPPTAERITDDSRREQQPGQTDAHRAEDPGAGDRTGAEVGRGGGDGRDRGHVGDEHEGGAEGDRHQGPRRVDVWFGRWFEFQTHP